MKQNVSFVDFIEAFGDAYKSNFSQNGKIALFDYLNDYELSTGEEIELDIVALCCDYTEYDSAWEAMQQYQPEDMPTVEDTGVDENGRGMDLVELREAQEKLAIEWLEGRTTVIRVEGYVYGVIIQNF